MARTFKDICDLLDIFLKNNVMEIAHKISTLHIHISTLHIHIRGTDCVPAFSLWIL